VANTVGRHSRGSVANLSSGTVLCSLDSLTLSNAWATAPSFANPSAALAPDIWTTLAHLCSGFSAGTLPFRLVYGLSLTLVVTVTGLPPVGVRVLVIVTSSGLCCCPSSCLPLVVS
jgi:hypothetical protein